MLLFIHAISTPNESLTASTYAVRRSFNVTHQLLWWWQVTILSNFTATGSPVAPALCKFLTDQLAGLKDMQAKTNVYACRINNVEAQTHSFTHPPTHLSALLPSQTQRYIRSLGLICRKDTVAPQIPPEQLKCTDAIAGTCLSNVCSDTVSGKGPPVKDVIYCEEWK